MSRKLKGAAAGVVIGGVLGGVPGMLIGGVLGSGVRDEETCLKCGGTGVETRSSGGRTGYKCSSCGRFWVRRS
jgi:hypothetical protein